MGDPLTALPNIGPEIARQLRAVGIDTAEGLRLVGAKAAWSRILAMDPSACINRLTALEGAVRGVRKADLPDDIKQECNIFLRQMKG